MQNVQRTELLVRDSGKFEIERVRDSESRLYMETYIQYIRSISETLKEDKKSVSLSEYFTYASF